MTENTAVFTFSLDTSGTVTGLSMNGVPYTLASARTVARLADLIHDYGSRVYDDTMLPATMLEFFTKLYDIVGEPGLDLNYRNGFAPEDGPEPDPEAQPPVDPDYDVTVLRAKLKSVTEIVHSWALKPSDGLWSPRHKKFIEDFFQDLYMVVGEPDWKAGALDYEALQLCCAAAGLDPENGWPPIADRDHWTRVAQTARRIHGMEDS